MRNPSILFINRVYAPAKGATGRVLSDLAQGFVADGWDVSVLTTASKAQTSREDNVFVKKLKASSKQSVLNYLSIWVRLFYAACKFDRTDIIVTMTDPPMLVVAGRLLAKSKGAAHIHWCQDMYPDLLPVLGVKFPEFLMRRLQNISLKALQNSARIVVIGRCMAAKLAKYSFDHRRMVLITNWPDREFQVSPSQNFHPEIKLGENINLDKPLVINRDPKFRVLYAGSIGRAHPVDTILDAAAILQISNPEIEFLFVGEGEGYDRLSQQRLRLGLENIRLLPPQPKFQLREMMHSGDLHLISMKHSAMGMLVPSKLYAALAAERPCIFVGPDKCEAAQVLKDYQAGSVIEQGDPKKLAEEIIAYRMDGSKWFEAHKGAKRGAEEFAAAKSINNWINCARSLIRYPSA